MVQTTSDFLQLKDKPECGYCMQPHILLTFFNEFWVPYKFRLINNTQKIDFSYTFVAFMHFGS